MKCRILRKKLRYIINSKNGFSTSFEIFIVLVRKLETTKICPTVYSTLETCEVAFGKLKRARKRLKYITSLWRNSFEKTQELWVSFLCYQYFRSKHRSITPIVTKLPIILICRLDDLTQHRFLVCLYFLYIEPAVTSIPFRLKIVYLCVFSSKRFVSSAVKRKCIYGKCRKIAYRCRKVEVSRNKVKWNQPWLPAHQTHFLFIPYMFGIDLRCVASEHTDDNFCWFAHWKASML